MRTVRATLPPCSRCLVVPSGQRRSSEASALDSETDARFARSRRPWRQPASRNETQTCYVGATSDANVMSRMGNGSEIKIKAQRGSDGGRQPGTGLVDRIRREVVSAPSAPLGRGAHVAAPPAPAWRPDGKRYPPHLHPSVLQLPPAATRAAAWAPTPDGGSAVVLTGPLCHLSARLWSSAWLRGTTGNGADDRWRTPRIPVFASTRCSISRWHLGGSGSWPFSSTP